MPLVGNIFKMVQKEVLYSGEYSEVAETVTETKKQEGITFTLSEAHRVKGDWSFEIPFKVDTEAVRRLATAKEENCCILKKMILSKYQATVQVEAQDKPCYVGLFTQSALLRAELSAD